MGEHDAQSEKRKGAQPMDNIDKPKQFSSEKKDIRSRQRRPPEPACRCLSSNHGSLVHAPKLGWRSHAVKEDFFGGTQWAVRAKADCQSAIQPIANRPYLSAD